MILFVRSVARSLVFAGLFGLCTLAAHADTAKGPARVVDGDTLDIAGRRVRLEGIDAPESAQRCRSAAGKLWDCGEVASLRLKELTAGQEVLCAGEHIDDYGRLIARCVVGGVDVNAELVREGLAWAFVKYSSSYVREEAEAREARRGVFAAENQPAWEFRAERWARATAGAAPTGPAGCPIKGNISRTGERIYHLPWQRDYSKTKITAANGERWFCDEREAEAAGWRRAVR